MSGGFLDHLVEASHIVAGMGCSFDEAMEIVKAAHEAPAAALNEPTPRSTIGNVVYGVSFGQPKPKVATHGTL